MIVDFVLPGMVEADIAIEPALEDMVVEGIEADSALEDMVVEDTEAGSALEDMVVDLALENIRSLVVGRLVRQLNSPFELNQHHPEKES